MLENATKNRLLDCYPMLREMTTAQFDDLQLNANIIRLPAGTVVFDENQRCQGYPLLLSGSIRVIKAGANSRELQLYRLCAGESCILTNSCLLGDGLYHARGVTEQEVEIVAIQPAAYKRLIANCEPFRNYIFGLFSERMAELMQLVTSVAFQKLDQRLAALLISKPNPIHITHQALADELGSVREIVSRLLKYFVEQGWISLGRERIQIIDALELKNFAER